MCVLHLHDKRCSLGIHESLVMIVVCSPCSWQLQCEMYVLQFYSNLFSVVLAQLRLTLRCRCIDASPSTPPHLCTFKIYIFTRSHPQIYLSTSPHPHICASAHLYHICTSTLSLLHICPVFLSLYISFLSPLYIYIFARSHPQIYLCTSIHLHIYIAPAHPHCHSFTSTLSFSLSIYLFDCAGQSHVSLSGQPSFSCHLHSGSLPGLAAWSGPMAWTRSISGWCRHL